MPSLLEVVDFFGGINCLESINCLDVQNVIVPAPRKYVSNFDQNIKQILRNIPESSKFEFKLSLTPDGIVQGGSSRDIETTAETTAETTTRVGGNAKEGPTEIEGEIEGEVVTSRAIETTIETTTGVSDNAKKGLIEIESEVATLLTRFLKILKFSALSKKEGSTREEIDYTKLVSIFQRGLETCSHRQIFSAVKAIEKFNSANGNLGILATRRVCKKINVDFDSNSMPFADVKSFKELITSLKSLKRSEYIYIEEILDVFYKKESEQNLFTVEGNLQHLRDCIGRNAEDKDIRKAIKTCKIKKAIKKYKQEKGRENIVGTKRVLKNRKGVFILENVPKGFIDHSTKNQRRLMSLLEKNNISLNPKEVIKQAEYSIDFALIQEVFKRYNFTLMKEDIKSPSFINCSEVNYKSWVDFTTKQSKVNPRGVSFLLASGNLPHFLIKEKGYKQFKEFKDELGSKIDARAYESLDQDSFSIPMLAAIGEPEIFSDLWKTLSLEEKHRATTKVALNGKSLSVMVAEASCNFEEYYSSLSVKTKKKVNYQFDYNNDSLIVSVIKHRPKCFWNLWNDLSDREKARLISWKNFDGMSLSALIARYNPANYKKFWTLLSSEEQQKAIDDSVKCDQSLLEVMACEFPIYTEEFLNSITPHNREKIIEHAFRVSDAFIASIAQGNLEYFIGLFNSLSSEKKIEALNQTNAEGLTVAMIIAKYHPSRVRAFFGDLLFEAQEAVLSQVSRAGFSFVSTIAKYNPRYFQGLFQSSLEEEKNMYITQIPQSKQSLATAVVRFSSSYFARFFLELSPENKLEVITRPSEDDKSLVMTLAKYMPNYLIQFISGLSAEEREKAIYYSDESISLLINEILLFNPSIFEEFFDNLPSFQKDLAIACSHEGGSPLSINILQAIPSYFKTFFEELTPGQQELVSYDFDSQGLALVFSVVKYNPSYFREYWNKIPLKQQDVHLKYTGGCGESLIMFIAEYSGENFANIWADIPNKDDIARYTNNDGVSIGAVVARHCPEHFGLIWNNISSVARQDIIRTSDKFGQSFTALIAEFNPIFFKRLWRDLLPETRTLVINRECQSLELVKKTINFSPDAFEVLWDSPELTHCNKKQIIKALGTDSIQLVIMAIRNFPDKVESLINLLPKDLKASPRIKSVCYRDNNLQREISEPGVLKKAKYHIDKLLAGVKSTQRSI